MADIQLPAVSSSDPFWDAAPAPTFLWLASSLNTYQPQAYWRGLVLGQQTTSYRLAARD